MARLQGRPSPVMPLHVVAGFLESDRGRRDSGVFGMEGMVVGLPVLMLRNCGKIERATEC